MQMTLFEEDIDAEVVARAEAIGVCRGCGTDVVAEGGANEECDDPEGCGWLNGSASVSYELAKVRRLLLSYAAAIDDGTYSDAHELIADLVGELQGGRER
jgi:hypothetical protein